MVAWWAGDGDARDLVGSNDGVLTNGATFTQGMVGPAFWFDGIDDQMRAPATALPVGTSDRTMEFWFRIDEIVAPEANMVVGYGAPGNWGQSYHIIVTGSRHGVTNATWSQWGSGIGGPPVVVGLWYHVAAASQGGVTTLYVNGAAFNSGSVSFNTAAGTDFIMGFLDQIRKHKGAIDEVCVYDRALSAAEISAIYAAGSAGKAKPVVQAPFISLQPLSRTNIAGTATAFTVEVLGADPLSCQWRLEGANLVEGGRFSGVTTTNLLIANVQPADAGGYTVVVTNDYGSVTSSVAQLAVISPGRFSNLSYSPAMGFSFIFRDATVGRPYRIQRSPSMAEGSWVDWQSFTYTEPLALTDLGATGQERRFYRAISP